MFTIWGITGQPDSYVPGAIREQRRIQKISRCPPVLTVVEHSGDSPPQKQGRQKRWTPTDPYIRQDPTTTRARAVLAKQIMTSPVETLGLNATIQEAWKFFQERRFRHVPVLGQGGILRGLLSDRDVLRAIVGLNQGSGKVGVNSAVTKIQDIMTRKVLTAHPETEIRSVARVLFEERIGAMPIVGQDGLVMGMITRSDILRTVMQEVPFELWI